MGEKGLRSNSGQLSATNLDFLLDIPLEVTVELGRTEILINELLSLGQGSVVELSKFAGQTLDLLANKKLIAKPTNLAGFPEQFMTLSFPLPSIHLGGQEQS